MVNTYHYTLVKTHTQSDVNYRLWVIVICQYQFIYCNKCNAKVHNVDGRGGSGWGGQGYMRTLHSAHFYCEPKNTLNTVKLFFFFKSFKKTKKHCLIKLLTQVEEREIPGRTFFLEVCLSHRKEREGSHA